MLFFSIFNDTLFYLWIFWIISLLYLRTTLSLSHPKTLLSISLSIWLTLSPIYLVANHISLSSLSAANPLSLIFVSGQPSLFLSLSPDGQPYFSLLLFPDGQPSIPLIFSDGQPFISLTPISVSRQPTLSPSHFSSGQPSFSLVIDPLSPTTTMANY